MTTSGSRYGVILWELLTNEEPWHDKTAMQVRSTSQNPHLTTVLVVGSRYERRMCACMESANPMAVGVWLVKVKRQGGSGVETNMSAKNEFC